jgi:hypothetical protein
VYSIPGDIYLPYAYDPTVHYEEEGTEKIYDVCAVGLEYGHRVQLIEELRKRGLRCHISTGPIFDEYRKIYSQSHIGINWSSLNDLNARAFETPMMSIPVMNLVSDMKEFLAFNYCNLFESYNDGQDNSRWVQGAANVVMDVMDNLDDKRKSNQVARELLKGETYDARIQQILDACGFGG